MNAEQIWMREPFIQCREEFAIYREIFEFVATDLKQIDWKGDIITEGAAYLPELMKQSGISDSRYISITPAKEFQICGADYSHPLRRDHPAGHHVADPDGGAADDSVLPEHSVVPAAVPPQAGQTGGGANPG